jgi:hypothetical protein
MRKSLVLLLATGCFPVVQQSQPDYAAAKANADARVDSMMVRRIEQARSAAKSGGDNEAWRFAKEVENAYQTKMVARGKVDGPALVEEAIGYLDAAPNQPQMLAEKGSLLITAGRKDEGVKALEESFKTPNLWPLAKLLEVYSEGRQLEIVVVCKKARGVTKSDDERYAVLDQCKHWGKDLAWASKDDVAFYEQQRAADDARAARENAAYRQKQEEDRQKMYASFSKPETKSNSSPSSASNAPSNGPVSVNIRSRCDKTVRVFFGDKPKFGSGTTSSISSNSIQSHSFRVGDQMWIVDEHDNGVSNTQISSSTREIEVSCTGLIVR